MKTLMAKFTPLDIQLLLLDGEVIFLCFTVTCFQDAKPTENRKQLLPLNESIRGKVTLARGVPGKTVRSIHLIPHV